MKMLLPLSGAIVMVCSVVRSRQTCSGSLVKVERSQQFKVVRARQLLQMRVEVKPGVVSLSQSRDLPRMMLRK